MTTTHTAASLAALHADDPRKLDALAAELIPVPDLRWQPDTITGQEIAGFLLGSGFFRFFEPSSDLNHAAMLEARLAERNLEGYYGSALMDVLVDEFHPGVFYIATATAAQRTIAAILAAQEAK